MLSAGPVVGVVVERVGGQALDQVLIQPLACRRRTRQNALNVVLLTEAGHVQRLIGGRGRSTVHGVVVAAGRVPGSAIRPVSGRVSPSPLPATCGYLGWSDHVSLVAGMVAPPRPVAAGSRPSPPRSSESVHSSFSRAERASEDARSAFSPLPPAVRVPARDSRDTLSLGCP